MLNLIDRGAKAMEVRRRDLIEKPLARIWSELMQAALDEIAKSHRLVPVKSEVSSSDVISTERKDR